MEQLLKDYADMWASIDQLKLNSVEEHKKIEYKYVKEMYYSYIGKVANASPPKTKRYVLMLLMMRMLCFNTVIIYICIYQQISTKYLHICRRKQFKLIDF